MNLNIFVSQNCFIHCKGCYSYSREEQKGKHVSTDNIIEFLKFAYDKGIKKVTLCGGDPLSREDIMQLLEKIKQIGFNISLDTVGTPIIKDIKNKNGNILIKKLDSKKIANNVDVIGIPIDGSTNEIFKRFRQSNLDILKDQLDICEELHKYNANICINTVVHNGNIEDAKELAKLIKKLDYISKWQIFQYEPLGKYGMMNRDIFEISNKQFLEYKKEILKVFKDDSKKVQFKSYQDRKKAYMLIDNSGNAWIPSEEIMSKSKFSYTLDGNTIIGNINNSKDWNMICSYLNKNPNKIYEKEQPKQEVNKTKMTQREKFINTISNNGELKKLLPLKDKKEDKKEEQIQIEGEEI